MSMLTRWDPLREMWREMDRLQRAMFDRLETPLMARGLAVTYPALNVWEDAEAVFAEAELPGLKLEDVEIYVTGSDQLTIKGKREPAKRSPAVWHRQERGFGSFQRTVTLPLPVEADRVEARLENGVLTIRMPKAEAAKPRKIPVKSE